MQNLVGIIRTESELKQALEIIQQLKRRTQNVKVEGNRHYNPGWHLALDLHSLLTFAEAATLAAIERKESRGGHTRDDFPSTDRKVRQSQHRGAKTRRRHDAQPGTACRKCPTN